MIPFSPFHFVVYGPFYNKQTQHIKKEDPSLWATQAHRQDHILKVWRHENGSTTVLISNSFKHLMMIYVV
jgi:hypothetical protein